MKEQSPELAAKVQAFVEWLRSTPSAALADEIVYRPVDAEAYERLFEQLGFALPQAWREWVHACGLLQVPALAELPADVERRFVWGLGLQMAPIHRLVEFARHREYAQRDGVAAHRRWLIFASAAGDLEPAFVLDAGFREGEAIEIGYYHQDDAYRTPRGADDHLPRSWPSIAAWLDAVFSAIRQCIEAQGTAVRWRPATLYAAEPRKPALDRDAAARVPLPWERNRLAVYRPLLRHTNDDALVERILVEIDRDLAGANRPTRTQLETVAGFPYDYPGPEDLFARLETGRNWGRLACIRWALERVGHRSSHEPLQRLWQSFIDSAEGGDPPPRPLVAQAARLALELPFDDPEYSYAQALCMASGIEYVELHWDAMIHAVGLASRSQRPDRLDPRIIYRKLASIVRGKPEYEPDQRKPLDARLGGLAAAIEQFEGPQRALLEHLESDWLPRLTTLAPDLREDAGKMIRKAIKSKKLRSARDELLLRLDSDAE